MTETSITRFDIKLFTPTLFKRFPLHGRCLTTTFSSGPAGETTDPGSRHAGPVCCNALFGLETLNVPDALSLRCRQPLLVLLLPRPRDVELLLLPPEFRR